MSRGWKERINCIGALLLDGGADEFRSDAFSHRDAFSLLKWRTILK